MGKVEILFKCIDIAIAIVGLILVIVGWIIPHKHSLEIEKARIASENELERFRWKKGLIDKQISDLYGPIYALILESDVMFTRILYQLGRNCVIPCDMSFSDLPENEQAIWKHYVDTYKIPLQIKIVEIMRNNLHLIYNSEIPTCYKEFLDYALGWEMLDNQKRNRVQNYYEYHYVFNYPLEFNHYIRSTLTLLLQEQSKLIEQTEKHTVSLSIR